MNMGGLSLLIDAVLIVLLGVVALYAVRLQRSLNALRNAKDEMAALLATYAKATEKAEVAIARLKGAAADETKAVRQAVERGEGIKADLDFMIQRATQIADRLDDGIRRGRETAPQPHARRDIPDEEVSPRRSAEAIAEVLRERAAREAEPQMRLGQGHGQGKGVGLSARRAEEDAPRSGRLRLGVPGGEEQKAAPDAAKKDLLRALQALR